MLAQQDSLLTRILGSSLSSSSGAAVLASSSALRDLRIWRRVSFHTGIPITYKMKKGGKKVISHGPAVLATCYHRNMNSNLHPRRKFPRKGNHQKWKQEINNRRPDERLKRKIK
jgi:hypothetical protein